MEKDIKIAKEMIDGVYKFDNPFYYEVFMWTTENIRGIVNKINFYNKSIFTVCSSGDHVFNFLLEGASRVVVFDINKFTEYLFYLKRAAIINLNYEQFLNFFFPRLVFFRKTFSKDTYNEIRMDIPEGRIRDLWDSLFDGYSSFKLYNSNLFKQSSGNIKTILSCNKYLNNESNYNFLKMRLKNVDKIDFYNMDLFGKIPVINEKFDFIYLSNILDFLYIKDKKEYLEKIRELVVNLSLLTKKNGIIGVCYLYCYLDDYWFSLKNNNIQTLWADKEIRSDCIDIIDFRSSLNLRSTRHNDIDALLLYKKRDKNKEK